jgi:adenylyltransferase/sulfurtransferase
MDKASRAKFAEAFYSRQTILRELGNAGQEKLSKARVAIVGVGGLGAVSSLYLALAGVGYLRLIDQDTVEIHNLHRQILYNAEDVHFPKVEIAAQRLKKINPLVEIEAIPENVNASNVEHLLLGMECVVDGLDNMATRYLVNRVCVKNKIPYVFGAAVGIEGNLSVFSPPETGCLECSMPNLSDNDLQTCISRGVIGATPGIIGSMQAMETIKLLTGIGTTLKGKLLVCDFNDMDFTTVDIAKSTRCAVCQGDISRAVEAPSLIWLCGKDTANINPQQPLTLTIKEVCPKIEKRFDLRLKSHLALMFTYKNYEVSLFNGGRMLIKGVTEEKTALSVYKEIMERILG